MPLQDHNSIQVRFMNELEKQRILREQAELGGKLYRVITLVAVAIGTIAICLILYPLTMLLPVSVSIGYRTIPVDWSSVGDMSTLVTLAVIIVGTIFAYKEYENNEEQRQRERAESAFRLYQQVYEWLMSPRTIEARRWIIINIPTLREMDNNKEAWREHFMRAINKKPRGFKGKIPPGREYINETLNTFDIIGFIFRNYGKVADELLDMVGPVVSRVWERIGEYVEQEAQLRNEFNYYRSARELGEYCLKWRRETRPYPDVIQDGT